MASVTLPVKAVAVLPFASRAVTSTAGVILPPATVLVGCTVNTRVAALPAVILNAVLVPVAGPVALAVRVYAVPKIGRASPREVAAPPEAARAAVQERTPPAALARIESVTLQVRPVA